MTRTVTLFEFMPYGAPELQSVARAYMVRALLVSAMISTMLFAAAGLLQPLFRTRLVELPRIHEIDRTPTLEPPPTLAPRVPEVPVAPATRHVIAGVPVPVLDEQAPPDQSIASQADLRQSQPGVTEGAGGPIVIEPSTPDEPLPDFGTYTYREVEPALVVEVKPEYPSIAKDAGVSGLVVVVALVGKDGHVIDARVDPGHSIVMLNDAALAAARKCVFTPALVNRRPVAVWVAVPFHFSLQ